MRNGKKSRKIKFSKYFIKIIKISFFLLYIIISNSSVLNAQSYKNWFLNQESVDCKSLAVGYAKRSYYGDTSAIKLATEQAYNNFIRLQEVTITGKQAFWTTELGNAWMGNNINEVYDTSKSLTIAGEVVPLDTMMNENFAAVLIGDKDCELGSLNKLVISIDSFRRPSWVDTMPQGSDYYYALGMVPEYYYESNSWIEAERRARLNLARIVFTKIEALQMKNIGGQDVKKETLSVQLKEITIVARWKDENKKICYVLAKVLKQ